MKSCWGAHAEPTTSLTPVFNPSVQTFLAAGFTQPLLNGFGRRANSTQIRIAKNDLKVADSVFRQQVITTLGSCPERILGLPLLQGKCAREGAGPGIFPKTPGGQ